MEKVKEEDGRTARITLPYEGYQNQKITLLQKKNGIWLARVNETGEQIPVYDEDFVLDPESGKRIYHEDCWDCGNETYIYYPRQLEIDSSDIKIKCEACGRLIEGERAEQILKECDIIY